MPDILHRIGVEQASTEQVYDALTTLEGIRGWWAENTAGESDDGGATEFRLGTDGPQIKVAEREPGRSVRWDVVGGADEWIGTNVQWDLRRTATTRSCCSSTRAGASRSSSCTTAAPSGRRSC